MDRNMIPAALQAVANWAVWTLEPVLVKKIASHEPA
jgi:hypothetical protein